jgi:hypothetical protein
MGREVVCRVRFGTRTGEGKALLESRELLFRGEPRLRIPFAEIRGLEARDGRLRVETAQVVAVFELGREAAAWAEKIRNPRGLMDKLGVKPGARVALVGVDDAAFRRELDERTTDVAEGRAVERDVVFLGATETRQLAQLERLRGWLQPAGALWVIWPKGRPQLREDDVRAAALASGLVDVKVASVSDVLSGLKLVIPVKDRPAARSTPKAARKPAPKAKPARTGRAR